jgi:hypothetical protein
MAREIRIGLGNVLQWIDLTALDHHWSWTNGIVTGNSL